MERHFAGINGEKLAAAAEGQDVLVSYADLRAPGTWAWMRPLLAGGYFRSVILDSGAFTVYAAQRREIAKHGATEDEARAKHPAIEVANYAAFAVENAELFSWVANMDDIGGRVDVSNANFDALEAAGLRGKVVPVWHEGETDDQLTTVIEQARRGAKILAVGMARPLGSLRPRNVVATLRHVWPLIKALAPDLSVHGLGLTRYASPDTCPCGGEGWAFDSVDSTTWIAEACALERSGACGTGDRLVARAKALRVTVDSSLDVPFHGTEFDAELAVAAKGQARTVALRHAS